jgi:DNA-directed RNA polymerase specialized sigma24 family protein
MLQQIDKYDPSIREHLDGADWDAVLLRVLKYAKARSRNLTWLGEKADPETLVHEAIARAYGIGTGETYRNWNRDACPDLATFLIGIVRSITSHEVEHESKFSQGSLLSENGSIRDNELFKCADETVGFQKPKNPEEQLIEGEELKLIVDELDKLSLEDEDLGMVILCIKDGISAPRQIAETLGFDIGQIYNLLKKLRRKFDKYCTGSKKQSSK